MEAKLKKSDYNIHVNIANYGIVECTHHHIMNIISQFIKMKFLKKNFSKIYF